MADATSASVYCQSSRSSSGNVDVVNMLDTHAHRVIEPRVLYFGTPVVLISTENPDGSTNVAPMSSAWWVGGSCMLGLDATSQTTLNLQRTGELVLNLPDSTMVEAVDRLALLTGTSTVPPHKVIKGYTHVADKFGAAGLTPIPSDLVAAARVLECPISLEASVQGVAPFDGEDSGLLAIEARVIRTHVRPELLIAGSDRHIDPEKWDPLIMKFTHFYGRGVNLHSSRLAKGWQVPSVRSFPHEGAET
ncbi:flavin reductase family protein [Aeromicrobium yanjiei]|uniref:flavin reductase family protein n=1 Tax=Aeromicrobium yanjiei TaxID=2662028 RepID=UPI001F158708|nr:flavin reductase family protein [Aeromicrobium yanjiei]